MAWMTRLWPPRCLLRGAAGVAEQALCLGCAGDLPRIAAACSRCGAPLPATGAGLPELSVCGACIWRPPPFARIDVPFRYAPPIDWLVRRLKFRRDLAAGRLLGDLLAAHVQNRLSGIDAVVPVPLHGRRLRHRGFNQAVEIATPLGRALACTPAPALLQRKVTAPPQMDLAATERHANVRGAFAPGARPVSGTVLLVDDVVTTASTVGEATQALLAAGAHEVRVVAAARA
jgi:ComF family protein